MKDYGMMRYNRVGAKRDRLVQQLDGGVQTYQDCGCRVAGVAYEESYIVPGFGESERGDVIKRVDDVFNLH